MCDLTHFQDESEFIIIRDFILNSQQKITPIVRRWSKEKFNRSNLNNKLVIAIENIHGQRKNVQRLTDILWHRLRLCWVLVCFNFYWNCGYCLEKVKVTLRRSSASDVLKYSCVWETTFTVNASCYNFKKRFFIIVVFK